MAKPLIVANWKMHPDSFKDALKLFSDIKKFLPRSKSYKVVICPPFPFLVSFAIGNKSKVLIGAQNISSEDEGPFTGEVDGKMLSSIGVSYCIVGHSERRSLGETDSIVSNKVLKALQAKLNVILCVGENNRDSNGDFFAVLRESIVNSLKMVSREKAKNIIIAYEPLWAIGEKSKGAIDPETLYETVIFIRRTLLELFGKNMGAKIPILYGGSIDENNAKSIVQEGKVQGLLVGRASLDPKNFGKIVNLAS